ncbi:MAG: hypothetical protein JW852_10495 [Spirochaetales bacterium]|nr:hypothetical protein [Spirochaetales bacterium]
MDAMNSGGSHIGIVLLLVIPFAGGVLCLLEKGMRNFRIARITAVLAVSAVTAVVFVLLPAVLRTEYLAYSLGAFGGPVGIELKIDGLAWIGAAVGSVIGLAAVLYSIGEGISDPYYYTLLLIMTGGMIGVVITDDLFTMFVLFEIVGVAAYVLIAYTGKRTALLAALRYLILSSIAMAVYLFGVFALYQETGFLSMTRLKTVVGDIDQRTVRLVLAALFTGIATRAALVPFHAWLPEAHAAAPHAISALLSGSMVKVSFIAVWRVVALLDTGSYRRILLWLGAAMALAAVARALCQSDAKKLLAWHTVSQMGFIVAAFGAGTPGSQSAAVYYVVAHALFKALLFLVVGATITAGGERDVYRASGYMRTYPGLFVLFLLGAFSICGIPPLNGFAAKKLVLQSLDSGSARVVYALLWATAVGTAASFIKLSAIFWRRPPGEARGRPEAAPGAAGEARGRPEEVSGPPGEVRGRPEKAAGAAGDAPESPDRRHIPVLVYVSAGILAALCIATGVNPGFWQGLLSALLHGHSAAAGVSVSPVYTLSGIIESIGALALGAVLYLALRTRRGRLVTARIKNVTVSFDGAAILVVLGFVALGGLAFLGS